MNGSVLVVQHTAVCPPARVGDWLTAAGCRLDVRRCYAGDALPGDLDGVAGLVVLGGKMGAYDDADFPWLATTKDLLREAVRRRVPTLAICLGHQLLAVAAGGRVRRSAAGPQVGLLPVALTSAAAEDPLFGALGPGPAVHWNNDVATELPDGAVHLASTPAGPQAYRLGDLAWAVQFHPEVDVEILGRWAAADVAAGLLEADQVAERLAAVGLADAELRATWGAFTARFAAVVIDWRP